MPASQNPPSTLSGYQDETPIYLHWSNQCYSPLLNVSHVQQGVGARDLATAGPSWEACSSTWDQHVVR